MCVYSVLAQDTRNAEPGETIELHQFHFGAKGFISPAKPNCAVCLPVGSQLMLSNIPLPIQQEFHLGKSESVTFEKGHHHSKQRTDDLVVFRNGSSVWLDRFMVHPTKPMTARVQSLRRLAAITEAKPLPAEEEIELPFELPGTWSPERETQRERELVAA